MKIACVSIVSNEYEKLYQVHLESLKKYLPKCDHIRYHPSDFSSAYKTMEQHICSVRPKAILKTFDKGYDFVIFLGSDVIFYDYPNKLLNGISMYNAIVTPHITKALPIDGLFPKTEGIQKTGHINSDLVVWKNCPEIREFLYWQDSIMTDKCISTSEIFLDQTWLNCLPFFVSNVHILLDEVYNVAYWNFKQRNLHKTDKWEVDSGPLVCYQFSGFDINSPEKISKHQNRYIAEGDFLEFLKQYGNAIK